MYWEQCCTNITPLPGHLALLLPNDGNTAHPQWQELRLHPPNNLEAGGEVRGSSEARKEGRGGSGILAAVTWAGYNSLFPRPSCPFPLFGVTAMLREHTLQPLMGWFIPFPRSAQIPANGSSHICIGHFASADASASVWDLWPDAEDGRLPHPYYTPPNSALPAHLESHPLDPLCCLQALCMGVG